MSDSYDEMYRGGPPRQMPPRPRYADPAEPPRPLGAYPQQPQAYYPPPPQQYAPQGHAAPRPPKRKRKIFLWVFLAVQVIFVIWIIAGVATKPGGQSVASQVAQQCGNGGWSPLFRSHADCVQHYAVALNDATDTGKGIGVAIVVLLWVVVDFFLAVGYGVYKLATR